MDVGTHRDALGVGPQAERLGGVLRALGAALWIEDDASASALVTAVPVPDGVVVEDLVAAASAFEGAAISPGVGGVETLLVRLKKATGLETLVPLHRLDRETAGVVLFSLDPASRGAYQALFRDRAIEKVYEAVAPWREALGDKAGIRRFTDASVPLDEALAHCVVDVAGRRRPAQL